MLIIFKEMKGTMELTVIKIQKGKKRIQEKIRAEIRRHQTEMM